MNGYCFLIFNFGFSNNFVLVFWVEFVLMVQKKIKEKEEKKEDQNAKKREKKVYDLPGQKRDRPDDVYCKYSSSL